MTRRRIEAGIGRAVGLVGASVLLAGCLSPKEDPTRFYVLSTSDASQVDEAWDDRPGMTDVGVGPFIMPGYLDRPQFVRRVGPNEVRPVEAARWAETLGEGFERVLAEDLDALRWRGARRPALEALCSELGDTDLPTRITHWQPN